MEVSHGDRGVETLMACSLTTPIRINKRDDDSVILYWYKLQKNLIIQSSIIIIKSNKIKTLA